MASNVKKVIGIEVVSSAIECAKKNAALNGIENASFYCGDAANTDKLLENAKVFVGALSVTSCILLYCFTLSYAL
jgi:tRNA/tmRNA/rRNA uracil-C5-methylase (TrmA/RlmC/RlmD family)